MSSIHREEGVGNVLGREEEGEEEEEEEEEEAMDANDDDSEEEHEEASADSDDNDITEEDDKNADQNELGRILYTFKLERGANDDALFQRILDLLKKDPKLASQRFPHEPYAQSGLLPDVLPTTNHRDVELLRDLKLFPFTYLLIGGANLEILRQVEEIFPDIIDPVRYFQGHTFYGTNEKMPDNYVYSAIQTACWHRSDEVEVIRFIAEKAPECVAVGIWANSVNSFSTRPVYIALDKQAPVETIDTLLRINPEVFWNPDANRGDLNFPQRSLWHQQPAEDEVVQCILKHFRKFLLKIHEDDGEDIYWSFTNKQNFVMSRLAANAAITILPILDEFRCCPEDWEVDAWVHFLNFMEAYDKTLILEVGLPRFTGRAEEETRTIFKAMREFLKDNTAVSEMTISANTSYNPYTFDEVPDQELVCAFQENATVSDLRLCYWRVSDGFQNWFRAPTNVVKLKLFKVDFTHVTWGAPILEPDNQSTIEDLNMLGCIMTPDFMRQFFTYISKMPSLSILDCNVELEGAASPKDRCLITTAVVGILRQNKLKSFSINCSCVILLDMNILCPELKENRVLTLLCTGELAPEDASLLLETVERHNTTLTHVHVLGRGDIDPYMGYYTLLNQCGRGQMRSTSISISRVVELLCGVTEDKVRKCSKHSVFAIIYGLLRECPGVWSATGIRGNIFCRKRKRDD